MIFDKTTLLSDAQAITADAVSTNVIDLLATGTVYGAAAPLTKDVGKGQALKLHIQVVEAFNTLTSLGIQVQVCAVENFGSGVKTLVTETLALADLVAGKTSNILAVPAGADLRYLRLNYDVTGTNPTTGKITAGLVMGSQTNGVDF